ncbi:MAG TPA: SDR family NAD(P)-dependent oxidoreductase [Candidatus Nanoarchaeia archaeon]|nr:SDR family NAD(P)-dependent oxidoreductase [Candidatus Nanoarchaeia archaeon]
MDKGFLYTGLEGKAVIVTGGSQGIGAAIVRKFAELGSIVTILDLNDDKGGEVVDSLNGHDIRFIHADLMAPDQCGRAVSEAALYGKQTTAMDGAYDRIDVLVNCAGRNDNVSVGADRDKIMRSLELNVGQYAHMISLCWPYLISSKGNVINIGSKTGDVGQKGSWAYSAAKGGVNALTYACARDGAPLDIRVNCVNPSEVPTELYHRWASDTFGGDALKAMAEIGAKIPLYGRMTSPEEIANAVVFLASNVLSSHTTGQILRPNGGHPQLNER